MGRGEGGVGAVRRAGVRAVATGAEMRGRRVGANWVGVYVRGWKGWEV